jgi:hypothetical protein
MVTLHFISYSTEALNTVVARDNDFDVVLIDTAGRMQDNEVGMHSPILRGGSGRLTGSLTAPYAGPRQACLCE